MSNPLTPDLCVIGAGSGGLSVAAAAAGFGVPVVLIEKHKMGGDCLNTGCVPSKALIAAAAHAQMQRPRFGVTSENAAIDFKAVHAHVHSVIASIAPNDSVARFTGLGVQVIKGEARFEDAETVVVEEHVIKARRFVIATGSVAAIPAIEGLAAVPYLTNETIFDLKKCPEHLLIIGAGPIGLELAQAFRRLGAQVTVLEAGEPLAKEDHECRAIVLDQLAHEGVVIRNEVNIGKIGKSKSGIHALLKSGDAEETIEASHLLVATGRRAVLDGLGLDKAGIRCHAKGIVTDRGLRTTNRRVYAIGDVAGGAQFTHLANYHAGLVVRNALFRLPVKANDDIIPRVTFTDPELAQVGLLEDAARQRHGGIRILRWPFHDNDRAQTEKDTIGHVKVITARSGKILGATIVGSQAGELIAAWSLAVQQGLNIRSMAASVLAYPTRAEAGKRAAIEFFTPNLTKPWLRRIIALLRKLG